MEPMPRIDAPTVAEHRRRRRELLLDAARQLLVTEGAASVTPARVGRAAGIARNSVYTYFDSRAQILAELIEADFTAWNAHVDAALADAADPEDRLATYLRVNLELAAAGRHRVATAIGAADLPPECRSRIAELHRELAETLRGVLSAFVADVESATVLVQGVLDGALLALERGAEPEQLAVATMRFVRRGLDGLVEEEASVVRSVR